MVASRLYYNKVLKTLKRTGFQLNTYNTCVENHLVNNKQQTIFFHVDNCKLIHQDSKVNNKFINALCDEYESVFEYGYGKMKVSRGKVHDYLCMTLDYSVKLQVKITMLDYTNGIMEWIDKAEPEASSTKSSAAPLNMFVADEDCEKLIKEKYETFHKFVANMLFGTKIECTDTGTAISNLTTSVRDPDQIDWMNMVNQFKYIIVTKYLPLILSA